MEQDLPSDDEEDWSGATTWEVINSLNETLTSAPQEEAIQDMSVADELPNWDSENNIRDKLLQILQKHGHGELHCTSCTLLRTSKKANIQQVSRMDYIYFPF